MRAFAQKPKATQESMPFVIKNRFQAKLNQARGRDSILHPYHTVGNQAVLKSLQVESEAVESDRTTPEPARVEHELSKTFDNPKANKSALQRIVRDGAAGAASPLPYLDVIQRSFGPQHDLGDVKAYVGGQAAKSAQQMGAEAYASGERVVFSAAPTLRTAAHEAAHVVQQRSGIRIAGDLGTKGDAYERQADAVADRVVAGRSSETLLGAYSGAAENRPIGSPTVQFLGQNMPYIGPLLSYLNPRNQIDRIFMQGLSPSQKSLLDGIFGNSLATSLIRLVPNSIVAAGNVFRTLGNVIHMPGTTISDSTLIHEAAHVWQSQNTLFGVGYAVSALRAMAIAQVLGGDWQRAYDYRNVERYRIPWRFWNAEQQASWIEDNRRLPSGWMLQGQLPNLGVESAGIE